MKSFTCLALVSAAILRAVSSAPTLECLTTTPNPSFATKTPLLPDPFEFLSGTPVESKEDWSCRRNEISQLFQQYELGLKPGPSQNLQSVFQQYQNGTGGNFTLTASNGDKAISWTATITYPNSTKHGGPYPALIALDLLTIPVPDGVAIITFFVSEFAQQDNMTSRGKGLFYELYPDTSPQAAGALMAWSWGLSRIMDALTNSSDIGIDPTHVGVVGCSRWGKGSLVAGAFDERIALTIVQESGSGGAACWRLSDVENVSVNGADTVQTAHEIVTENVWFSTEFEVFASEVDGTQRLPFDHHMLAGLVAPRGLLVIDNLGYEWLSPWSSYGCMTVARQIYKALGDQQAMGYTEAANHTHCQFPVADQGAELDAFVGKYLLGEQSQTDVFRTEANFTFDMAMWIDWDTPDLS
ncbi:carbohydrate-binding module 1 [Exophiala xenobiotica]|nr:carbohydrate-binding module 1 [Exophiala xenobiotica]KAK5194815.1 carbohydrate-binding module 1 [Exophiala xenobiotica]KAK5234274.1 carbohydrate-binding module 1 [Exophiala xenobiotica]KAK5248390.1 carbohydrate-binding module 1 [Exophiala xenobiotica]KAK5258405.1 carbohydrate-binding module 1 [Exophiala xenobiotica]